MTDGYIGRNEFVPAAAWSLSNALHMMKLSWAVYAGTADDIGAPADWSITERLVGEAGYSLARIEARRGIYEPNAMVCADDASVFLVFRGTEPASWKQWITDANLRWMPCDIGRVHRGFARAVDLVWDTILEQLRLADPTGDKALFVAGHSLGAGMSQVAASRLALAADAPTPTAIYHFGCPRAFDVQGAGRYAELLGPVTYRVVNNNDIVCDIPPPELGFRHVGDQKYLTADGLLLDSPSPAVKRREGLLGGLDGLLNANLADAISDHMPAQYARSLATALRQA